MDEEEKKKWIIPTNSFDSAQASLKKAIKIKSIDQKSPNKSKGSINKKKSTPKKYINSQDLIDKNKKIWSQNPQFEKQ